MKKHFKLILLLLVIIVLLPLCSCGNNNKDNSNKNSTSSSDNKSNIISQNNKNINSILSEEKNDDQLIKAIKTSLGLSDDALKETRYYYNNVDLNNDSNDETIVQLVGPYTSGTGGDTLLIFTKNNNNFTLLKQYVTIKNPIIISDKTNNGWKDIIVGISSSNNGEEFIVLKYNGTTYSDTYDSEVIASLDTITGTAIISNDIAKDFKDGKGLYLSD